MADLDDESQAKMSDLYEKLQEKGFTGVQTPGLPFHISLASYPLDKEKDAIELIKKVAREYSPVPIEISHIGVFAGGKVMFGAPDMNSGLTSLHEACLMADSLQEYGWTPHVCRHTYCSNMARSGMNPKNLQYLMGHSDISVTMNTYTHLGLDDAKEEMIRMEELNQARKELEKGQTDKAVTQKQFKVV